MLWYIIIFLLTAGTAFFIFVQIRRKRYIGTIIYGVVLGLIGGGLLATGAAYGALAVDPGLVVVHSYKLQSMQIVNDKIDPDFYVASNLVGGSAQLTFMINQSADGGFYELQQASVLDSKTFFSDGAPHVVESVYVGSNPWIAPWTYALGDEQYHFYIPAGTVVRNYLVAATHK